MLDPVLRYHCSLTDKLDHNLREGGRKRGRRRRKKGEKEEEEEGKEEEEKRKEQSGAENKREGIKSHTRTIT